MSDLRTPRSTEPVRSTEPAPPGEPPAGPSRRRVLGAVAVAGASAAVLAACGGGPTAGPAGGTSSGPGATGPGSGDASGGGANGPLVATADVPVGGGVVLEAEKVVVTQPAQGTFKAFTAVCTHQSCTVASVKADRISCECHGSAFSAKDGSVLNGPATRPLKEITVSVEGDQVVRS